LTISPVPPKYRLLFPCSLKPLGGAQQFPPYLITILVIFQIRRIFDGIGVEMTTDVFEKIWETASTRHPNGLVKKNPLTIKLL